MITNEKCEIIRLTGLLEGLKKQHNSLIKVTERPDNRHDLSDEIKRVKNEIIITEEKLKQLKIIN